ncbi:MAG: SusC/RagA family TonB-linked outer membrane protein [Chitinophaga sp.]|uniref:SusC/RagA family TonB-linked outer membrane protein n=1 Tax=Chitinophaga sp. TaxID=1869181 RepID=UPI001B1BDFE1|nr:SusC/RagA family TonB-linked outer membrane protein [Chitinophaga sp.]MBO9730761.1 SusC/RagA family TonB-linked outer membrane protein [Chitinophaga sp.]
MRLSALLLMAGALQISAKGLAQRVTMSVRNTPLSTVFNNINRQTGYIVFYNYEALETTRPVTVEVKNATIQELLHLSLMGQGLEYAIEDKTITVTKIIPSTPAQPALPAQIVVSGRITDENGIPLAGVSVVIKGTNKGTQTNTNGEYTVVVKDENAVLSFTYIGFEKQELVVGKNAVISLQLKASNNKLTGVDVVNTGYQMISRERATGSFSVIDPYRLRSKLKPDVKSALEGQATGVVLTKEGNLEIRGVSTMLGTAASAPLLVIDGYPTNAGLESLNIDNIESITILKDAVAASIYGARSSNGVIVVATRQGRKGALQVEYKGSTGITLKPDLKYLNRASSADYVDAEIELYNLDPNGNLNDYNDYNISSKVNYLMIAKSQGWLTEKDAEAQLDVLRKSDGQAQLQKYYFRNQFTQQHNISLSGGSEKSMLNAAVKYISNQNNTIRNSDNRLIFDMKNDWRPGKRVAIRLFSNVNYATTTAPVKGWQDMLAYTNTSLLQPYDLVVDPETGTPLTLDYKNARKRDRYAGIAGMKPLYYNPLEDLALENTTTKTLQLRLGGSINIKLLEGLNVEAGGSWSRGDMLGRSLYDKNAYRVRLWYDDNTSISNPSKHYVPDGAVVNEDRNFSQSYMFRTQLNFSKLIGSRHRVAAIAGNEISRNTTDNNSLPTRFGYNDQAGTFATFNYADYNAGNYNADKLGVNSPSASIGRYQFQDNRFVSWYANGSYEYDNRFILSGSIRLDQTNFFGTDPRYRYKPLWSAGGTYKLAEEKFFQVPLIDRLDLRASYGINGNISLNSGPFLIITPGSYSTYTGDISYGITSPPNNSLRWEKTKSTNLGVDVSLLKRRINVTLDYYLRNSSDLLAADAIDPTRGFSSLTKNVGQVRNQGYEISIDADVIRKKGLVWNTFLNFSYNNNKVITYNVTYQYPSSVTNGAIKKAGDPLDALYSYRYAGLDNNGVSQFYSAKNEKIGGGNVAVADMVYSGTLRPKYAISLTNSVRVKNFDLSFMLIAKMGNVLRRDAFSGSNILNKHVGERWRKPGDEAKTIYPKLSDWNMDMFYFPYSDILIESGNYMKLRDITLTYDINPRILKQIGFTNARIYLQSRNLLMITANSDHRDPETSELNLTGGTGAFTEQGFSSLPLRPEFYVGLSFTL